MAESKMVIYIGRDALESIIIFDDEYPNLHQIFKSHAILCVDLSNEELDDILSNEESDIATFCLMNDIQTVALKDYFSSLQEDKFTISEKPRAMFFFDVSEEEAKSLSAKYGVIVQSEKNINDKILQLSFRRNLDKGQLVSGTSNNGWRNLLTIHKLPPMNSLIISDNYLFQNEVNGKLIGFENLKMILDSILPLNLEVTFHLLVIAPMPQKISPEKADQLNGMLKTYLRQIRNYDFQLEVVFNNTIHPRKIISNYFVIVCDKGFQLFHPDKTSMVFDDNEVSITSILHDTRNISGDTLLAVSSKDIEKIRKSCKTLRDQIQVGIKDPTKKIIGDTNKDKSIRNRLIN